VNQKGLTVFINTVTEVQDVIRGIMFRIGNGIDVHKLISGQGFLLGGIKIPSLYSIDAHSDGDILYHAISDALLGSIGIGDIGKYFPDNSDRTLGMNSEDIFLFSLNEVRKRNYRVSNIDNTILLQAVKLRDFIDKIRLNIANAGDLSIDQVSIKATTTEKMGFVGENKGIVVYSTVLIHRL